MNALDVINSMDRMPNNVDRDEIVKTLTRAESTKILNLSVFVCPKFLTEALLSGKPEEYMPVTADDPNDLFFQRIPKIKQVLGDIRKAGIVPTLNILIGDNDAEVYIYPFLPDLKINPAEFDKRRKEHLQSYVARASNLFDSAIAVESLGLRKVVPGNEKATIADDELKAEVTFFGWLFGESGPYKGKLKFDQATLEKMARLKFALYGAQGNYLKKIGGILLQTEGPGVWLQRTMMLRCTGARAIPAIYPWIRKEELRNM
ncbi:hypothetical protein GYA27_03440 [candidate division WWE3 bacterium]|uniref:Uncharacterized protein n=1 Tax=candidate division WWE3 bacterium TaxID=2053526 RepID=A0A7X9DL66_UNCKA|nr:hypothetical protein [candidate division WWE3 bacterium]